MVRLSQSGVGLDRASPDGMPFVGPVAWPRRTLRGYRPRHVRSHSGPSNRQDNNRTDTGRAYITASGTSGYRKNLLKSPI